jgi:alkylation response protein AidB-like acyl-CoA dehydrogenase
VEWDLTEDQRLLVAMVRDFAEAKLRPQAAELDKTERFPIENLREMAALGLMGMTVPEQYGGSPMGHLAMSLAITELARGCAATAVTMGVTNMVAEAIFRHGTEAQKQRYIPRLVSGDRPIGSFCLTEPEAGSDAASLKTRAERDGDHWVLNGQKIFISHGDFASVFIVWARTGSEPGAKGVSCFLVERDTPGLVVSRLLPKMGQRGNHTVALAFENCRVPHENMLGELNRGFQIAMAGLDGGRINVASQALGMALAALDATVEYAKIREQFGQPIGRLGAIQEIVANISTQIEAARALILRAAWLRENKKRCGREASMAKLFTTEALQHIVKDAIQVHGGYGYTKEYVVERLFRDARVTTIYEGTSEIQRLVIARKLLKD